MAKEQAKKQYPSQAYFPIISGRVPYKLKLKIEEESYKRQMALQTHVRLILEKAYEECGGIEGMDELLNGGKEAENLKKRVEDLKKQLEAEQSGKEKAEKKAAEGSNEGKERKKLQSQLEQVKKELSNEKDYRQIAQEERTKLEQKVDELKQELSNVKKDRDQLSKRLDNANHWRKKEYTRILGQDPPKNGW